MKRLKPLNHKLRGHADRYTRRATAATRGLTKDARKHAATAIAAAFAFLIALTWRDAISEGVNKLISLLELTESAYLYKIVVAVVITVICVIGVTLTARFLRSKAAEGQK